MLTQFKVGDTVSWWSQSGGAGTQKVGAVVRVMNPWESATRAADSVRLEHNGTPSMVHEHGQMRQMAKPGLPREGMSYLVRVGLQQKYTKSCRLYWPRVSALTLVEGA